MNRQCSGPSRVPSPSPITVFIFAGVQTLCLPAVPACSTCLCLCLQCWSSASHRASCVPRPSLWRAPTSSRDRATSRGATCGATCGEIPTNADTWRTQTRSKVGRWTDGELVVGSSAASKRSVSSAGRSTTARLWAADAKKGLLARSAPLRWTEGLPHTPKDYKKFSMVLLSGSKHLGEKVCKVPCSLLTLLKVCSGPGLYGCCFDMSKGADLQKGT